MSLTYRLLAFFLVGLALVLAGFSATLFLLARSYLHRQLDEKLEAALNTLEAAAEVEQGGIEWEKDDKRFRVGGAVPDAVVKWTVHSGEGRLIDSSRDMRERDPLRRDLTSSDPMAGWLPEPLVREDRRGRRRMLAVEPASATRTASGRTYSKLIFTAAASKKPGQALLERLAAALMATSLAIWSVALFTGRWFCRRALRPVTEMAGQARAMTAELRAERLRVPPSGDELEALGQSFNGLLDRLHEALERQRRFTGDASHQLRTPLTALLGQLEIALRHPRTANEYRHTLEMARQQGQHLRQIVEMLLYLARADADARLENLEPLDLKTWLAEFIRGWSSHPRSGDLQILLPAAEKCRLQVQAPLLGQLLGNLIDNACQYSPAGSPLVVNLAIENERAILSVEDRGMGIAEADLPHLFEPFYRAESARAQGRAGVGLGLSIAQRIAHLFGGTLSARGAVGQGSRFELSLPLLVD